MAIMGNTPPAPIPAWAQLRLHKTTEEVYADAMEVHAYQNMYLGPPYAGSTMFNGWPLTELAKKALPHLGPSEWARAQKALLAKHSSLGLPMASAVLGSVNPPPPNPFKHSPEEMLAMRMRWAPGIWAEGFEHIAVYVVSDKVHLWIISKDAQSTVLEDEVGLYPSDALVTKLNIIKG